jgi:prepilin-type N-terminal cleavage/methylation domain-containing protein
MKRGQAGFSLMELIVVMGIVGSMLAIAAPAADRKAMSLPQAAEELQSQSLSENFLCLYAASFRYWNAGWGTGCKRWSIN